MLKKPVEIDPKMIYGQLAVIRRISFTGRIYEGGGRRHGASQIPHRAGRCTDHREARPGTRLPVVSTRCRLKVKPGNAESPRAAPSFQGDAKCRTRNFEIPRCAIAHLRFASSTRPGMTKR